MKNNLFIEPLVSILMTAYNREHFIAEAIGSVLASTYKNWELIICDDCSTDTTFKIAKAFASSDTRIRLFKNDKNLGDYPNRNNAASKAKGEYIVIVDSDDIMFPDALVRWVNLMLQKDCAFGIFVNSSFTSPVVLEPTTSINRHFFKEPILMYGPIATIIKRNYFNGINGFPEKYGPANDMYYNLKAASGTNTLVFQFPLVDYRVHAGQEFNNKYSYLYNNFLYLRDALDELDLPLSTEQKALLAKKNKRRFLTNLIKYFVKSGDWSKTRTAIRLTGFGLRDVVAAVFQK